MRVHRRRSSRAAGPGSPRAARRRPARSASLPAAGSPRSTGVSTHSLAEAHPPRALLEPPAAAATGRGSGRGDDQRQADVDEDDLAVGVAVAVALLVGALEALDQVGGVGLGSGPAPPARRPGRRSAARRRPRPGRRPGRSPAAATIAATSAAIRSALRSAPLSITVRAVSRRRSEAQRPSAERTPPARGQRIALDAELGGDRRGVHRAGAAEGQQGEAARVDAALDRDDAQRPHHLLVGDADDPGGRLARVEAERRGERGDRRARPPRRRARRRRRGRSRRRGCRAAGWRR